MGFTIAKLCRTPMRKFFGSAHEHVRSSGHICLIISSFPWGRPKWNKLATPRRNCPLKYEPWESNLQGSGNTNWVVQQAGLKLVILDSLSRGILSSTNRNVSTCSTMYGPAFFAYAKTEALISCAVIVQLISTFFFVTWIDLEFFMKISQFRGLPR